MEDIIDKPPADVGGVAADRLRSFIERLERMEEEKQNLQKDIKEIFSEVKSAGFDVKIVRQILRLRKIEEHVRRENEELLELYKRAIGMD
jgi:uncharacterized protein (UPF0335 family)